MANLPDTAPLKEELAEVFNLGDEARARELLAQLGPQPRKIRAVLEEMLAAPDATFRQAAAFGLGELGGAASVKRLERQLALEEARGGYDGEAVIEVIAPASLVQVPPCRHRRDGHHR